MRKNENPIFFTPPWEVTVRDYECDLQGILNNSVYLNYYEHARSLALKACQLSLGGLAKEGIFLVTSRIDTRYRRAVYPGQTCVIHTSAQAQGVMRVVFSHRLFCEGKLCNESDTTVAAAREGRPQPIKWLLELFITVFPQHPAKETVDA